MIVCKIEGCEKEKKVRGMCHMHYGRWQRHGDPHKLVNPWGTQEERFWRYVERGEGCWRWTGHLNMNGYGHVSKAHRAGMEGAHRVSYRLHKGDIPKGLVVMHTCDNPACVNPEHLKLGTMRDNTQDMLAKGRGNHRCPNGVGNPNNKLTEDQVREIKFSTERGVDLAARFGISATNVSDIRSGRIWKHIT